MSEKWEDLTPSRSSRSYGLLESVGQGRTNIDGDDDAEYFEICSEIYGGGYVRVYESRAVQPDGQNLNKRGDRK
jgi:hypothetical protein